MKQFGAPSRRMERIEVSKILISKEVIRILSPLLENDANLWEINPRSGETKQNIHDRVTKYSNFTTNRKKISRS